MKTSSRIGKSAMTTPRVDTHGHLLIAEVLEKEVADGVMDEEQALRFVRLCYLDNPDRIFGLKG